MRISAFHPIRMRVRTRKDSKVSLGMQAFKALACNMCGRIFNACLRETYETGQQQ